MTLDVVLSLACKIFLATNAVKVLKYKCCVRSGVGYGSFLSSGLSPKQGRVRFFFSRLHCHRDYSNSCLGCACYWGTNEEMEQGLFQLWFTSSDVVVSYESWTTISHFIFILYNT